MHPMCQRSLSRRERQFPGFVGVGCTLHVLNLVLMNWYHSPFEKEELGVNGALRIGFIVNYLRGKELDKWRDFAIRHGKGDIAYLACGAKETG